jgi:hypothetical protein
VPHRIHPGVALGELAPVAASAFGDEPDVDAAATCSMWFIFGSGSTGLLERRDPRRGAQ